MPAPHKRGLASGQDPDDVDGKLTLWFSSKYQNCGLEILMVRRQGQLSFTAGLFQFSGASGNSKSIRRKMDVGMDKSEYQVIIFVYMSVGPRPVISSSTSASASEN